jgi:histidyl-tRNA synthetase
VSVVGEDEFKAEAFRLKDMKRGSEYEISFEAPADGIRE